MRQNRSLRNAAAPFRRSEDHVLSPDMKKKQLMKKLWLIAKTLFVTFARIELFDGSKTYHELLANTHVQWCKTTRAVNAALHTSRYSCRGRCTGCSHASSSSSRASSSATSTTLSSLSLLSLSYPVSFCVVCWRALHNLVMA